MLPFPELETERLRLREVKHADAHALLAIRGDEQAMRFMGTGSMKSLEEAHQLVSRFATDRAANAPASRWALERKSDQALIGTCGVFNWVQGWKKCALGYELAPAAQGQGYMHEALLAALQWSFSHMKLHRIEALIQPQNQPSIKLARGLGFEVEGTLREVAFWNDSHHDMVQLGLLYKDFHGLLPSHSFSQLSEGLST